MNQALIYEASRYWWIHESDPIVIGWIKASMPWATGKEAWCGIFMAVVASACGAKIPKLPMRANSWKNAGKPIELANALPGDVAVLRRTGGLHVGLIVRLDGARVYVFGGNQSNRVCTKEFTVASIVAIRRLG